MRRGRSDPSAVILEQLVSPLHDIGGSRPRPPHASTPPAAADKDADGPLTSVSDSALDMRVGFFISTVTYLVLEFEEHFTLVTTDKYLHFPIYLPLQNFILICYEDDV